MCERSPPTTALDVRRRRWVRHVSLAVSPCLVLHDQAALSLGEDRPGGDLFLDPGQALLGGGGSGRAVVAAVCLEQIRGVGAVEEVLGQVGDGVRQMPARAVGHVGQGPVCGLSSRGYPPRAASFRGAAQVGQDVVDVNGAAPDEPDAEEGG